MRPAFSVIFLTTLIGAGQGLFVALYSAELGAFLGVWAMPAAPYFSLGCVLVLALLTAGLFASFFHLGRPERAWRSAAMWRTSWLSREVIVLPAFIALVALWWLTLGSAAPPWWTRWLAPLAAVAVAALLWYCTAMIYACLRFIEEWAQPFTVVNFVLIGLSSGFVLASALAAVAGEQPFLAASSRGALVFTTAAWVTRMWALRRNAAIRHRSTLQSATGIRAARLVQTSMGMSAGSFNTREFFHRASLLAMRRIKWAVIVFAFATPVALLAWGIAEAAPLLPWVLAALVQLPGLLADRWYFFAQARHPQNLYYQVVS